MEYSITELSRLSGVSTRTLRYYDEIGLLKPLHVNGAGYRFYGEREVALLQQILFYRERSFDLKSIQRILYQKDFDLLEALQDHLLQLQERRAELEALIRTVEQTIRTVKGEGEMTDQEKFEAFKRSLVEENEKRYGTEILEKYGQEEAEAPGQKLANMTRQEYEQFRRLEEEIKERLNRCVRSGAGPKSREAGEIVALHREWLSMVWKRYTPEAHRGLGQMYVLDERFRAYYDGQEEGCARLLSEAIAFWAGKERLS